MISSNCGCFQVPVCGVEGAEEDCVIGVLGRAIAAILREKDHNSMPPRDLKRDWDVDRKRACVEILPVISCDSLLLQSCEVSMPSPGAIPYTDIVVLSTKDKRLAQWN